MKTLSDAQLAEAIDQHLRHECQQLSYCVGRLIGHAAIIKRGDKMALLESFVIHARCLVGFLYLSPKEIGGETDIAASHFTASAWPTVTSKNLPPAIKPIWNQACTQVAHLSSERLGILPGKFDWPFIVIEEVLKTKFRSFATAAHPKWQAKLRAIWPEATTTRVVTASQGNMSATTTEPLVVTEKIGPLWPDNR